MCVKRVITYCVLYGLMHSVTLRLTKKSLIDTKLPHGSMCFVFSMALLVYLFCMFIFPK